MVFFFLVANNIIASLFLITSLCDEVTLEVNFYSIIHWEIKWMFCMLQGLKVPEEIYQTQWYKLPLKIQNRIPLLIALNQQPRYLSGYKLFSSSRNSFRQVTVGRINGNEYIIIWSNKFQSMRAALSMILSFRAIIIHQ